MNSLPSELNAAYEGEMTRIKKSGDENYEIARRALSWIHYAKRPLYMPELREAIAIDPIESIEDATEECADLDPQGFTDPEAIIQCCGSLLLWESSTDVVRFSHYTVAELFKSDKGIQYMESELYVAATCLSYVCFDAFNEGPCCEWLEFRNRVQK